MKTNLYLLTLFTYENCNLSSKGARYFSLFQIVQAGSRAYTASCSLGTWDSVPGCKAARA